MWNILNAIPKVKEQKKIIWLNNIKQQKLFILLLKY